MANQLFWDAEIPKFRYLKYQKETSKLFFDPEVKAIVKVKSRRIGESWSRAHDAAVYTAMGRGNVYYVGYNLKMGKEFIADAREKAAQIAALTPAVGFKKSKQSELTLKWEHTKCKITILPSNAKQLRGKGKPGDIIIVDEAAYVDEFDRILETAPGMTQWGGKLVFISTYNGDQNAFFSLISEIEKGNELYRDYHLLKTTIDDAREDGFYKMVFHMNNREWSEAAEEKEHNTIVRLYGPAAAEELYCQPRKAGTGFFTKSLILRCVDELLPHTVIQWVETKEEKEFSFDGNVVSTTTELMEHCKAFCNSLKNRSPAKHRIGFDPARTNDASSITVVRKEQDETFTVHAFDMHNVPFSSQKRVIDEIVRAAHRNGGIDDFCVDMGSEGREIADHCIAKNGATGIRFNDEFYSVNMSKLRVLMEDGKLALPNSEEVQSDFLIVQIDHNNIPKIPKTTRNAVRGLDRHGDIVASLMTAFCHYGENVVSADMLNSDDNFFAVEEYPSIGRFNTF